VSEDVGRADHPEPEPVDRPEPQPDGGDGVPESDGGEYVCDICGSPMLERHCRIVCPVCGYQRDCSDP
jgi:rubrerythrin